jgi:hypothetical protein
MTSMVSHFSTQLASKKVEFSKIFEKSKNDHIGGKEDIKTIISPSIKSPSMKRFSISGSGKKDKLVGNSTNFDSHSDATSNGAIDRESSKIVIKVNQVINEEQDNGIAINIPTKSDFLCLFSNGSDANGSNADLLSDKKDPSKELLKKGDNDIGLKKKEEKTEDKNHSSTLKNGHTSFSLSLPTLLKSQKNTFMENKSGMISENIGDHYTSTKNVTSNTDSSDRKNNSDNNNSSIYSEIIYNNNIINKDISSKEYGRKEVNSKNNSSNSSGKEKQNDSSSKKISVNLNNKNIQKTAIDSNNIINIDGNNNSNSNGINNNSSNNEKIASTRPRKIKKPHMGCKYKFGIDKLVVRDFRVYPQDLLNATHSEVSESKVIKLSIISMDHKQINKSANKIDTNKIDTNKIDTNKMDPNENDSPRENETSDYAPPYGWDRKVGPGSYVDEIIHRIIKHMQYEVLASNKLSLVSNIVGAAANHTASVVSYVVHYCVCAIFGEIYFILSF